MKTSLEQLFSLIPEQSLEFAMIVIDAGGAIRYWNPGAARIFGVSSADIVGKPSASLFTREDVARGIPELEIAVAREDGSAEDDRWMARPDGSRFWATGAMVALRGTAGELLGFVKILRNRTDLKELMESLRLQAEAADAVSRRKDVFLSTLSHELRNPLAPLTHATQLLRMAVRPTPELEPTIKIIERQVESLRRLVDDLLDVTRISTGKVELNRETISLQDVIRRAMESAALAVRERRQKTTVLMPQTPIRIEADPARLEQVLLNLIHNAAKYTPEQGKISVIATVDGREAVMTVQDNGIGIPHEMLPRIFDLFTQVEASRYRSEGGLGIGLALVKDLVTLHGGSVQVRSDGPGMGSEFTVRIPLAGTDTLRPNDE